MANKPANKTSKLAKQTLADKEYNRLVALYTAANVDGVKLKVNDSLIRKVAEVWAELESIKDLPTIIYDRRNPNVQKETPAGKMRVKYMAQYTSAMQKLNKEMLGAINADDDDDLGDFE